MKIFKLIIAIVITVAIIVVKCVLYYNEIYLPSLEGGSNNPLVGTILMVAIAEFVYCMLLCLCMDEFEGEDGYLIYPLTSLIFILVGIGALIHLAFKKKAKPKKKKKKKKK